MFNTSCSLKINYQKKLLNNIQNHLLALKIIYKIGTFDEIVKTV